MQMSIIFTIFQLDVIKHFDLIQNLLKTGTLITESKSFTNFHFIFILFSFLPAFPVTFSSFTAEIYHVFIEIRKTH